MPDGWLLDATEAPDGAHLELWVKDEASRRVAPLVVPFRPPFLVDGPRRLLEELAHDLDDDPDVAGLAWRREAPTFYETKARRVLAVTPRRNDRRRQLAASIDRRGEYRRLLLYDVDMTPGQLYHLAHGTYPFAPVDRDGDRLVATIPAESTEIPPPPLVVAPFEVVLAGHRRGTVVPPDPRIAAVRLGEARIEGDEAEVFRALSDELARLEPDVLLSDDGDGFDLPWLYDRARAIGLTPRSFALGRLPAPLVATGGARTFVSYGRIYHRPASFPLPGRFHVDRESSFVYDDAGIDGLVDAARLSRISLQTVARQSPGTAFTAMEIAQALRLGVHVPWKKNRPEAFKSARRLVDADRGGVILVPPPGVFDSVDEFDFASLYPHIMVRHNLSAETLDCACCPESPERAPGLGYRSCQKRVGLIPRTLGPILARRFAWKRDAARTDLPDVERRKASQRAKMLKWVLVTAFGYQGYRNARFGRIECHEAINAYARDLIARLVPVAEAAGYRVRHGLVDSMWLTPLDPAHPPDAPAFAESVSRTFDLPLNYEGRYRWIVFLPTVEGDVGVPNRYYGRYESGEFKLRGIGLRRHDTPEVVRRFETELLAMLGRAGSADEVRALVPRLLARADAFAEAVRAGTWPREELLVAHRVARRAEEFVAFTDTTAALRQLKDAGIDRGPGETVRYLIADRRSRAWRDRVRVAERLTGDERYDADAYLELLARSAETLFVPLGIDRALLGARWGLPEPPARDRYRSVESAGQRNLIDGPDRPRPPKERPRARTASWERGRAARKTSLSRWVRETARVSRPASPN
jgi:DNA polymerase elongation subunit (family B)